MAASASEIEDFLSGPLVSWLKSCLPNPDLVTEYHSLFDGEILHQLYLQIDPEPSFHITKLAGLEDQALILGRVKNFDAIVKNVKALYEEELGMTLLVVPECICMGKAPESREGLENMKLLILLLLGAAVQCPNKELFITRIKELDVELQHNIVECIKQVTDMQTVVLTPDAIDLFQSPTMFNHMRRLAKERDHYLLNWASLVLNEGLCDSENEKQNKSRSTQNVSQNNGESQHLAVELADWKSRLRKQRQELEEKSEQLSECREELEHTKLVLNKLRADSQEWFNEARKSSAYRDEVDALREKADRCDRLEQEMQRYRDRLADAEYYKTRVTELREDNKALMETRDALEEQLQRARKRADQCLTLEAAMIKLKREANDIALERDADQQKIQELIEENNHLQYITKSVLSESNNSNLDTDNEGESTLESGENSLSEQLTSNAQARALKLELENKRLLSTIDNLREQSILESGDKILELEKEKKKLSLKCEQLQENCNRLMQQNSELEDVFKNALEENRKLQDSLDSQKAFIDRQSIDRDSEKNKLQDFEKHLESLTKDKQRIQMLCDSIQRRADDLEKTLDARTKELNMLKPEAEKVTALIIQTEELKTKLTYSEKEAHNLQREVNKLREAIEEKDVTLDKVTTEIELKKKEIERLVREVEIGQTTIHKLQDLDQKTQELKSQKKVDSETIQTLQKDLISEKVNFDRLRNCMEKIGINVSEIISKEVSVEDLLEKIITNNDHEGLISEIAAKANLMKLVPCSCDLKEKLDDINDILVNPQIEQLTSDLAALQASLENSQAENAKLQVNVATLNSQNGSLISQQMTLQLANSQLAAEKEEVIKQLEVLKDKQDNLLRDQVALQTLHEQLNSEYELLLSEREPVKIALRDIKLENRELKEKLEICEKRITDFELERENLKIESRNLTNLRAEHSKLKDDFRNLFTASDRLKNEYRNMQEEYRNLRSEVAQLKLRNTEISGEMNTKLEIITSMELEINKTNQHCEMLVQMNKSLDADRRSLMDHVSQLLTQYHELLAHSLKDKQHYHEEEKMFADKVNALCRQKEKLEEKIMEHYKKLDNCTTKRRGFGASFVKKVRKAGTDLINKVPSRNNKRIEDASRSKSQLTLAGSESGESDPGSQDIEKISKISDQDPGSSNPSVESPRHSSDSSFSRRFDDKLLKKSDNTDISGSIPSLDSKPNENNFVRRLSTTSMHSGGGDDALIRASLRRRPHKNVPSSHRNSYQGLEGDTGLPVVSTPSPVFGTAGTRRTVYVADDNPDVTLNSKPQSTPIKENPTYLVYNRISTVIGDGARQTLGDDPPPDDTRHDRRAPSRNEKSDNSKESAIWYEYGCV
ncbi:protein Daple [Plodia interpunctella]|uniref:protein Daple n=1 Tax=Plodia interpunctella TaxID=58824 RepID=UPI002368A7D0|nr:protein Daple [Plodia interpunctella]XP_053604456.1 protein Daple [Plodia interpunctella]